MATKNAYPMLPVVAYKKTAISSTDVAAYIAGLSVDIEVKRAAYIIFGNESAYGSKGINNNLVGLQADGNKIGRGFDGKVIATTVLVDSMKNERRFCVFNRWQDSIDYLIQLVKDRGLYVGGYAKPYANLAVTGIADFAVAYYREYVFGSKTYTPTFSEKAGIIAQYATATAKLATAGATSAVLANKDKVVAVVAAVFVVLGCLMLNSKKKVDEAMTVVYVMTPLKLQPYYHTIQDFLADG